ncbi:grainyhead-like protein 2 homolog isoform X2 [Oscarella lobularis]|uniref:grainyhead-like protein 2 homolog isoform X2 n=1 Tax=Oscarella lobularis TaxID=121494 RepID=UPI0033136528
MTEDKVTATATKHLERGESDADEDGNLVSEWTFQTGETPSVYIHGATGPDETVLPLNLLYDIYNVAPVASGGETTTGAEEEGSSGHVGSGGVAHGPPALVTRTGAAIAVRKKRGAESLTAGSASGSSPIVVMKSRGSSGSGGSGSGGSGGGIEGADGSKEEEKEGGEAASLDHIPPQTLFSAIETYRYTLDAPTSVVQKRGEDSLTYLNKGQFYSITVESLLEKSAIEVDHVKSIVQLVFREKDAASELGLWQYWYSQQANPNQRAFDVGKKLSPKPSSSSFHCILDRKSCQHVDMDLIDDMAYNASGFVWNPQVPAKIVLRINCLSTEFSSQKGVKGIPLYLQVDTYEDLVNASADPVHRACCRIKIFRDKGAERKNKDESKSAEKRLQRIIKTRGEACVSPSAVFNPPSQKTALHSTSTLGPKPILFTPLITASTANQSQFYLDDISSQSRAFLASIRDREHKRTLAATVLATNDQLGGLEFGAPSNKNPRLTADQAGGVKRKPALTIYVRKEEEKVYNALMLDSLTVVDFKTAVSRKYNVPAESIKYVYKTTKRGLLVNFDDDMVEQFSDEDDFIIKFEFDNQTGHVHLYVIPTAYV